MMYTFQDLKNIFGKEAECLNLADRYVIFSHKENIMVLIANQEIHNKNEMLFGFVRFSENFSDVEILFSKVMEYMKDNNIQSLIGPINYCSWFSYRWISKNISDISILPEPDNKEYHIDFLNKLGFTMEEEYDSAITPFNDELHKKSEVIFNKVCSSNRYKFEALDCMPSTNDYLRQIYDLSCEAFSGKPYYTNISFESFSNIYMSWLNNIDYRLFVCTDMEDKILGFGLGYKNPGYDDMYVIKTTAFLKNNKNKLLPIAFRYFGNKYCLDNGFKYGIYHYQHSNNKSALKIRGNEAEIIKQYATYRFSL